MSKMWVFDIKKYILVLVIISAFIFTGIVSLFLKLDLPVFDRQQYIKHPIYSVERNDNQIAVTINAVWDAENTDQLLSFLDEMDIRITFFLGGYWLEEYPHKVKLISDAGHEIGNHLYTHPYATRLTADELRDELSKTEKLIKDLTGKIPDLFRPPFGDYNNQVLDGADDMGYQTILWNIDSLDWKELDADSIYERVYNHLESGAIILMHINGKHTLEALEKMIPRFKEEGFDMVTLGELVYQDDYYIDESGVQKKVTAELETSVEFKHREMSEEITIDLPDTNEDGFFKGLRRKFRGVNSGVSLEGIRVGGLLVNEVDDIVDKIAASIEKDPDNAHYNSVKREIVPASDGIRVDVDQTIKKVMKAGSNEEVGLVINYIPAEVTVEYFDPVYHIPTSSKELAFSFNVSWGEDYLHKIVDILNDNEVTGTFFFAGSWAERFPNLIKLISDSGHEIGNHGFRHIHPADLNLKSAGELIKMNDTLLGNLTDKKINLFTPPYGESPEILINAAVNLGYRTILWSIDSQDWKRPDSSIIYENIINNVEPGAIILMHPTEPTTEVLPRIIKELQSEGYFFGGISELLEKNTASF